MRKFENRRGLSQSSLHHLLECDSVERFSLPVNEGFAMVRPQSVTMETLLDVARDLTAREQFDAAVVLGMLDTLQHSDLDAQACGAVTHARLAAQSAQSVGSSSRDAMARFALARVVTLLEAQVGSSVVTEPYEQTASPRFSPSHPPLD